MDATFSVDATSVVVSPRYMKEPVVKSDENWETAYHGTWWYSVWLVLQSGVFLESNDRDKGVWVVTVRLFFVVVRIVCVVVTGGLKKVEALRKFGVHMVYIHCSVFGCVFTSIPLIPRGNPRNICLNTYILDKI